MQILLAPNSQVLQPNISRPHLPVEAHPAPEAKPETLPPPPALHGPPPANAKSSQWQPPIAATPPPPPMHFQLRRVRNASKPVWQDTAPLHATLWTVQVNGVQQGQTAPAKLGSAAQQRSSQQEAPGKELSSSRSHASASERHSEERRRMPSPRTRDARGRSPRSVSHSRSGHHARSPSPPKQRSPPRKRRENLRERWASLQMLWIFAMFPADMCVCRACERFPWVSLSLTSKHCNFWGLSREFREQQKDSSSTGVPRSRSSSEEAGQIMVNVPASADAKIPGQCRSTPSGRDPNRMDRSASKAASETGHSKSRDRAHREMCVETEKERADRKPREAERLEREERARVERRKRQEEWEAQKREERRRRQTEADEERRRDREEREKRESVREAGRLADSIKQLCQDCTTKDIMKCVALHPIAGLCLTLFSYMAHSMAASLHSHAARLLHFVEHVRMAQNITTLPLLQLYGVSPSHTTSLFGSRLVLILNFSNNKSVQLEFFPTAISARRELRY